MKANYKNWMPKGMILSFAAACAVCLLLTLFIRLGWLRVIFLIATVALACVTLWTASFSKHLCEDNARAKALKAEPHSPRGTH